MMNLAEDDRELLATLSSISPMGVDHAIPDPQAEAREHCCASFGRRITDGALVFHLFPPLTAEGVVGNWKTASNMTVRLKAAIDTVFDTDRITCGYEETMDSFYIICGGYGDVPDMRLLVKRFLDAIDAGAS